MRVATFEGDVADRAEEWLIYVTRRRRGAERPPRRARRSAPARRSTSPRRARSALAAVKERSASTPRQLREISAKPAKQKARTDWTFTFADTTIAAAPAGRAAHRRRASPATKSCRSARYVHVPEEWERAQRAASTRNLIMQIAGLGGVRRPAGRRRDRRHDRVEPRAATRRASSCSPPRSSCSRRSIELANGWPALLANLPTAAPLQFQLIGLVAVGGIGLTLLAADRSDSRSARCRARLPRLGRIADGDALPLGVAGGLFGAAVGAVASRLRTPDWARFPPIDPLGNDRARRSTWRSTRSPPSSPRSRSS